MNDFFNTTFCCLNFLSTLALLHPSLAPLNPTWLLFVFLGHFLPHPSFFTLLHLSSSSYSHLKFTLITMLDYSWEEGGDGELKLTSLLKYSYDTIFGHFCDQKIQTRNRCTKKQNCSCETHSEIFQYRQCRTKTS